MTEEEDKSKFRANYFEQFSALKRSLAKLNGLQNIKWELSYNGWRKNEWVLGFTLKYEYYNTKFQDYVELLLGDHDDSFSDQDFEEFEKDIDEFIMRVEQLR